MNDLSGADVRVHAWHSRNHQAWILDVRHGSNGPLLTFAAKYGRRISDQIIDTIEAIEAEHGDIE